MFEQIMDRLSFQTDIFWRDKHILHATSETDQTCILWTESQSESSFTEIEWSSQGWESRFWATSLTGIYVFGFKGSLTDFVDL